MYNVKLRRVVLYVLCVLMGVALPVTVLGMLTIGIFVLPFAGLVTVLVVVISDRTPNSRHCFIGLATGVTGVAGLVGSWMVSPEGGPAPEGRELILWAVAGLLMVGFTLVFGVRERLTGRQEREVRHGSW